MKDVIFSILICIVFCAPNVAQNDLTVYESFDEFEHLLHSEDDKIHVINFWATWCKPCIEELPYFEELNASDNNIEVILVSLDFKNQIESKLKPFLERQKLLSEVVVLTDTKYNDWLDKVNRDWSGAIPATFIYQGAASAFKEEDFKSTEEIELIINSIKI